MNKKFKLIILAGSLIVIAAAVLLIINPFKKDRQILQSKFSMDYFVSIEDPNVAILDVGITINISKLSKDKKIYLIRDLVNTPDMLCEDENGNAVEYMDNGALIEIGPIDSGVKTINIKYPIMVGYNRNPYGDTLPYKLGCLFEDMLIFSGENVLMTPLIDSQDLDAVDKYISHVSFELLTKYDWQSIIPFQTPLSDECSFYVSKPAWGVFNSINKSAFCFGHFDEIVAPDHTYYVDKGITDYIPDSTMSMFSKLMGYYTNVFGSPLDSPFVLLRNYSADNALILGGVGAECCAMSINLRSPDDCETLSRTVFYAFFDSKIKAYNLRYAPNNWVYKGLGNYYVTESGKSLPDSIRYEYSIEIQDIYELQYLRYLYFSLKEAGFLLLEPAIEADMSFTQNLYYMDTKVPVLISTINDIIKTKTGQDDGFIKSLVEYAGSGKKFDIDKMFDKVCGSDAESIRKYFTGSALVPNNGKYCADDIFSPGEIVQELGYWEETFTELFTQENMLYPFSEIFLLSEKDFRAEAAKQNVHYSSEGIENEVKSFSVTLDRLLLQYAMRCKLAGIDDITDLDQDGIKFSLQEDVNIELWHAFCEQVGFDVGE